MKTLVSFFLFTFIITFGKAQVKYVTQTGAGSKDGSSWANAWGDKEFGDSLYLLSSTNEVWVAKGIYKPTKDENGIIHTENNGVNSIMHTFSIPRGVKLYGGFEGNETSPLLRNYSLIHTLNSTVLSGEINNGANQINNASVVVMINDAGMMETIDGLSIQNARLTGIVIRFSTLFVSKPVVHNCVVKDNYLLGSFSGAIEISGNSIQGASMIISNTFFTNNRSYYNGAAAINGCHVKFENCIFYKNFVQINLYGGASCIKFSATGGEVNNCTFFKNGLFNTDENGPVIVLENAIDSIYINNSIFWNNYFSGNIVNVNVLSGLNLLSVKKCLFQSQTSGTNPSVLINSIDIDPHFVNENLVAGIDGIFNTPDDGLALSPCSPLQDLGNSSIVIETKDILGNPRIYRNQVDIGAAELQQDSVVFRIINEPVSISTCVGQNTQFSVSTQGPNMVYQWQEKNGTVWSDLNNGLQYNGVNSASLIIISPPISLNSKVYRCKIDNNACNSIYTNEVVLSVYVATNMLVNPVNVMSCENGKAVFSTVVDGGGFAYQWQVNTGVNWANIIPASDIVGINASLLIIRNLSSSMNGYKYRCIISSNCGNIISGEALLTIVQGGATRLYVDNSKVASGNGLTWNTAFKTIDEALDVSGCLGGEKEIWVAKGTYYPSKDTLGNLNPIDPRTKTFTIRTGYKFYGGFNGFENNLDERNEAGILTVNRTILSGDIDHSFDSLSNTYHVVMLLNVDDPTIFNGFVVEKGNANNTGYAGYGGGFLSYNSDAFPSNYKPVISNCLFRNNYAIEGGGMFMDMEGVNYYPIIKNCIFNDNSCQRIGAAIAIRPMSIPGFQIGIATIDKCFFENNRSLVGTVAFETSGDQFAGLGFNISNSVFKNNKGSNSAGAISFLLIGSTTEKPLMQIANCVFDSNYAGVNGGAISYRNMAVKINNSTFFDNTAVAKGGAIAGFSVPNSTFEITNSIFWNNKVGSAISNFEFTSANLTCTIRNSVFQTQPITPLPSLVNCLNTYPSFVDTTNRIGNDNIWGSSDDGLALQPGSACRDMGLNEYIPSFISTDITGNARVKGCRVDMGAYEETSVNYNLNGLYGGLTQTCTQLPVNTSTTVFIDTISCHTMATIIPNGPQPLNGLVRVCVNNSSQVQFYNGIPYVSRYYDILPSTNASNATARITLFYTQQDFNNYNLAAPTFPQLPIGPGDVAGIAHIMIEQNHGVSLTGVPGTYNGSTVYIDPDDNNIIWNSMSGVWEISFDVTGFSGFFLNSFVTVPIDLLSFNGKEFNKVVKLNWKTSQEVNANYFDIQRSSDGIHFSSIGKVNATGNPLGANYSFDDIKPFDGRNFYQLLMFDLDHKNKRSDIIKVNVENEIIISILPNPIQGISKIYISGKLSGKVRIDLFDINGRKCKEIFNGYFDENPDFIKLDRSFLSSGIYILELKYGDRVIREKLIVQ